MMTREELASKVDDLRMLQRMIDEATSEAEHIKDLLKQHMTEQNTEELTGGNFKITWKSITTSRLDGKALKAELPELAARFTKTTTSRRFVVA